MPPAASPPANPLAGLTASRLGTAAAVPGTVVAARQAAGAARFSALQPAAQVLPAPAAAAMFDQAVGDAVAAFAATERGEEAIRDATRDLDVSAPAAEERISRYISDVAADPMRAGSLASACLASLLHGEVADLVPLLAAQPRSVA